MHDVAGAGDRDRGDQRVIAANVGVGELRATVFVQSVRLTDRGVDIDDHRAGTGSATRSPRSPQQHASDLVELADVTPCEATQAMPISA